MFEYCAFIESPYFLYILLSMSYFEVLNFASCTFQDYNILLFFMHINSVKD